MANTVNDVMNVIASPDYGIKNIAGTNQEILAILSGTHNSKNNIYSIVDDVKNLLQKLVHVSTEKKSIEVGNKSSKINPKNIQNILDETKNIRKSIDNLAKSILKQSVKGSNPAVAKLSDKASQKVADAMVKDMEKQNKNGGMTALVDAFTKLKNISIKDIIFGKKKLKTITKIFKNAEKDLKIKEKDLNSIIKLVNAAPEMIKSLSKINRKVNKIIKNDTITKLGDILVGKNSILTISESLKKNEKLFTKAAKISNDIKELISSLKKTLRNLFFASLWSKVASFGIESIDSTVDKILTLSKKLSKNKKDIKTGTKNARKITVLIGNLLVTSIFLTAAVVTGLPALLGALFLKLMVNNVISIAKKLSKNKKHIGKAILSAIGITAFTGLMTITSLLLTTIAKTGLNAMLGSVLMLGIVVINVITFKILSKTLKTIAIGAIGMLIMSLSLMVFSSTVKKITDATKGVTFKQVAVIAAMTLVLAGSVMLLGIPALFPFILLGSISMGIMGFALRPFAKSLSIIAEATKKLKMKHVLLVAGAMTTLALTISGLSLLLIPVILGNITLKAINKTFGSFVRTLKIINDMGNIPKKKVKDVLSAMSSVKSFFKGAFGLFGTWKIVRNARIYAALMGPFATAVRALSVLSKMPEIPLKKLWQAMGAMSSIRSFFRWNKVTWKTLSNSYRYGRMMVPFVSAVRNLSKLKNLGGVPIKFVHQALNAISQIGGFFRWNKLHRKAIWNARRYRSVMSPFGSIVNKLKKLKEMGGVPIKFVHQALNAINEIGGFFRWNKLHRKAIWNARRYRSVMSPFESIINRLGKLKQMGGIPRKLVNQALNAMNEIANYYTYNPISRRTIKASWRYFRMLYPFGYTIKQLSKLKEMGSLPRKLVNQTLEAIGSIADFYQSRQLGFWDGIKARISASMITGIVKSFGRAVNALKKLKELRNIPTSSVNTVLNTIDGISNYYRNVKYSDDIEGKSEFTKYIVDKFIIMAKEIQGSFAQVKEINQNAVLSIASACHYIISYYTYTKFFLTRRKVRRMNEAVRRFAYTSQYLKNVDFKIGNFVGVKLAVKSMKYIMRFLKRNTLNAFQRRKAYKSMSILSYMSSALSGFTNINPSNISSIGDAISNTLTGVNSVDLSQVQAVTNMFNAFNEINKSENIINKFAESVKEFTETCKNLMDAMNYNTDAINNMDSNNNNQPINTIVGNNIIESNIDSNNNQVGGIRIANVDEIAKTIAEKINGSLSVDIPDTQVQLLINGTGGNEWTISRY